MAVEQLPLIGLALGGGGVYGLSHIGILKVLEREGIPVSMITATSAGCIIGALWASGMSAGAIETEAEKLRLRDFLQVRISRTGIMDGSSLARTIERLTGTRDISELKLPLRIVTTDLRTGKKVVFDHGPLGRLVLASSSVPGIFPPVKYGGLLLVDGGLVENVPVATAREQGADFVIGVNLLYHAGQMQKLESALEILLQSMHLLLMRWSRQIEADADVVIAPEIIDIRPNDYGRSRELIQAGENATETRLSELRKKLSKWSK